MDEGFPGVLAFEGMPLDIAAEPAQKRVKAYPCRRVLDTGEVGVDGELCSQPSTYHALGNDARYGHLCGDCWQGQDATEQALYAFVAMPVSA